MLSFRAAQSVAENQDLTRFVRPGRWGELPAHQAFNDAGHRDLPWNAMLFVLDGEPYSAAYMSHRDNPEPADFSERKYGRFGEFVPFELTPQRPLRLRYRWWIVAGHDVEAEEIEHRYGAYNEQLWSVSVIGDGR